MVGIWQPGLSTTVPGGVWGKAVGLLMCGCYAFGTLLGPGATTCLCVVGSWFFLRVIVAPGVCLGVVVRVGVVV